jgi:hypothetical protein
VYVLFAHVCSDAWCILRTKRGAYCAADDLMISAVGVMEVECHYGPCFQWEPFAQAMGPLVPFDE